MHYKTLVSNLDRRTDRWYTCLGALLSLGHPPDLLQRFSAHDGDDYESYEHARDTASRQFPHSPYICENKMAKHYYCWSWTWYEMMTQIAEGQHDFLTLLLIDDFAPHFSYIETCKQLKLLDTIYPVRCAQLSTSSQVPPGYTKRDTAPPGEAIPGTPFRHKINQSGDHANVISREGAKEILRIADNHINLGVPNWVFWYAGYDLTNFQGYYCANKMTARILSHNKHINSFEDGMQRDPATDD